MGGRPLPGGREPSEAGGAAVLPLRRVDLLLLRVLPSPSLRCVYGVRPGTPPVPQLPGQGPGLYGGGAPG